MTVKAYNPGKIAKDVIDVFAKYEMPICFKDEVYKAVDDLLSHQTVVTTTTANEAVPHDSRNITITTTEEGGNSGSCEHCKMRDAEIAIVDLLRQHPSRVDFDFGDRVLGSPDIQDGRDYLSAQVYKHFICRNCEQDGRIPLPQGSQCPEQETQCPLTDRQRSYAVCPKRKK